MMRTTRVMCWIGATICGVALLAGPPKSSKTDYLQLRRLDEYVKVTEQPFKMHDSAAGACRAAAPADAIPTNPHDPSRHTTAYCNVYVNSIAKEVMLSGKGTYPVGSLVIKSKLSSVDDSTPDLFTVMQKMPAGYDSQRGDWKYIVVDGAKYREMAAGRIDSCIGCHEHYNSTDYETRDYLPATGGAKR